MPSENKDRRSNRDVPVRRFWCIVVITMSLFYFLGYIAGYQNGAKKNEIKNLEVIIEKQEIRGKIRDEVLTDLPSNRASRIDWLRKYTK